MIDMSIEELKKKALSLPLLPGVYIMKDEKDRVIYVGKAKKLKNRVSQYFQNMDSHSPKTKIMVSKVDNFDVIVASSEFEALVLECSLIKQYMPRYNILLKDDKGYPYIRIDNDKRYPTITMVNRIQDDGASYFGPFGSRGVTGNVLDEILKTFNLPRCSRRFPGDIGKGRPCLHKHMKQCEGWCQDADMEQVYRERIGQARQLLSGNYKDLADALKNQMLSASEELNFEQAAILRDRLAAIEALGRKQFVTAGSMADTDVIGYAETETKACFSVLHFSGGKLLDKEYEVFPVPDDSRQAVSSVLKQYYINRGFAPRFVFLPFALDDSNLFQEFLREKFHVRTQIKVPKRGDGRHLVDMAVNNAQQEAERITDADERVNATVAMLGKMLAMEPPRRIEAYDISNTSGSDIVASMVVFVDGKPKKSAYRHFAIEGLQGQDDYASMRQVVMRRFARYLNEDPGFSDMPDLVLIDGGVVHAGTAVQALSEMNLHLNVFGMVKDDRHRTRALVTPWGDEIAIDMQQSVFSLIGSIQEETHRFAITYHRKRRSKRLRYSELDKIPGVGPKRKQELLKAFKSVAAIRSAGLRELEQYLPKPVAETVFKYFNEQEGG